jgi:hypothetical protein
MTSTIVNNSLGHDVVEIRSDANAVPIATFL